MIFTTTPRYGDRLFYRVPGLGNQKSGSAHGFGPEPRILCGFEEANVVGSRCGIRPGEIVLHQPVLDFDWGDPHIAAQSIVRTLDLPDTDAIDAVPSSTPSHYHLYVNVPIGWDELGRLLGRLLEERLIEPGYAAASLWREQTFVRLPHIKKVPIIA